MTGQLVVAIDLAEQEVRRAKFCSGYDRRGGTPTHEHVAVPNLTEGQWRQVAQWLRDLQEEEST